MFIHGHLTVLSCTLAHINEPWDNNYYDWVAMRVFTIDVAKGCVSFELWLPEQMGRFDKWSIAVLSRHGAALPTLSSHRRIPRCCCTVTFYIHSLT